MAIEYDTHEYGSTLWLTSEERLFKEPVEQERVPLSPAVKLNRLRCSIKLGIPVEEDVADAFLSAVPETFAALRKMLGVPFLDRKDTNKSLKSLGYYLDGEFLRAIEEVKQKIEDTDPPIINSSDTSCTVFPTECIVEEFVSEYVSSLGPTPDYFQVSERIVPWHELPVIDAVEVFEFGYLINDKYLVETPKPIYGLTSSIEPVIEVSGFSFTDMLYCYDYCNQAGLRDNALRLEALIHDELVIFTSHPLIFSSIRSDGLQNLALSKFILLVIDYWVKDVHGVKVSALRRALCHVLLCQCKVGFMRQRSVDLATCSCYSSKANHSPSLLPSTQQ